MEVPIKTIAPTIKAKILAGNLARSKSHLFKLIFLYVFLKFILFLIDCFGIGYLPDGKILNGLQKDKSTLLQG